MNIVSQTYNLLRRQKYELLLRYKKPYYLCSYPRSGRTWLRFMLANYLNKIYHLELDVNFYSLFTIVPNLTLSPEQGLPNYRFFYKKVPLVCCSHSEMLSFGNRPVILLVRNIYDTLISDYFLRKNRQRTYHGELSEFFRDPDLGVSQIINYFNTWITKLHKLTMLVITYEAMQRDTTKTFSRVIAFLQIPLNQQVLEYAIKESSFTRMSQIEQQEGSPGKKYDPTKQAARRVREGKIGGSVKYLSLEDREYVTKRFTSECSSETLQFLAQHNILL